MEAVSKATANAVAKEIEEAVNAILEKHGLQVTKSSAKYGDVFKYTVEASAVQINEDGINLASPDAVAYQRNGYIGQIVTATGVTFPTLECPLGTRYVSRGKTYVLAGVRSRGKDKILMVCKEDGKTYVFSDAIIPALNANA